MHDLLAASPTILQTPKSNPLVSRETPKIGQSQSKSVSEIQKSEDKSPSMGKNTCNCKKSKCLKLYCDCFAFGGVCGPECNCLECSNVDDNEERKMAIDAILDRNPNAFKPKI